MSNKDSNNIIEELLSLDEGDIRNAINNISGEKKRKIIQDI